MYNLVTNIGGNQIKTPTSKGVGYVCYEDPNVAKKVKEELNKQYIPGYEHWKDPLIIEYFKSKSQREIMNQAGVLDKMQNENLGPMLMNSPPKYEDIGDNIVPFDMNQFEKLSSDEAKIEYLGDRIYQQILSNPLVKYLPNKEKNTAKITGMIIGIDNQKEIIKICTNSDKLNANISEALNLLRASNYDFNS